ncbi:hypothetical protein D3C87_1359650 [compost metagenome]
MRETYSSNVVILSDEVVWKSIRSCSFSLLAVSLGKPSLSVEPNSFQKVSYWLRSFVSMSFRVANTLFTTFLRICVTWRSCCKSSRETLSDKSLLSTKPFTKRRYDGKRSLQSDMMKTRLMKRLSPYSVSRVL